MNAEEYIDNFQSWCASLEEPIISIVCKRALQTMYQQPGNLVSTTSDFPDKLNFVDVLSIEIQSMTYDEIAPIVLEEYIDEQLHSEYNKLTSAEKLILMHSNITSDYEFDESALFQKLHGKFYTMVDNHYYTRKIRRFVERCSWL